MPEPESTIHMAAGLPRGRLEKNAAMRALLIDRLCAEYSRKLPQHRRERLRTYAEKQIHDLISDDDKTVTKSVIQACEEIVASYAYDLSTRPKTPPPDLQTQLRIGLSARTERAKERQQALAKQHSELVSSIQSVGYSEPPSLNRMRAELHVVAREALHRLKATTHKHHSGSSSPLAQQGAGEGGEYGYERDAPGGVRSPVQDTHSAKVEGLVRQAQAAVVGAQVRLQEAQAACSRVAKEYDVKELEVARLESRLERAGREPALKESLAGHVEGARKAKHRAYLRLVTAQAEVQACKIDLLRARERVELVKGYLKSSAGGLRRREAREEGEGGRDRQQEQEEEDGLQYGYTGQQQQEPQEEEGEGERGWSDENAASPPISTQQQELYRERAALPVLQEGARAALPPQAMSEESGEEEGGEGVGVVRLRPFIDPWAEDRRVQAELLFQATRRKAEELTAAAEARRAAVAAQQERARVEAGHYAGPAGVLRALNTVAREEAQGALQPRSSSSHSLLLLPGQALSVKNFRVIPARTLLGRSWRVYGGGGEGEGGEEEGLLLPSMASGTGREGRPGKATGPLGRARGQESEGVRGALTHVQEQQEQEEEERHGAEGGRRTGGSVSRRALLHSHAQEDHDSIAAQAQAEGEARMEALRAPAPPPLPPSRAASSRVGYGVARGDAYGGGGGGDAGEDTSLASIGGAEGAVPVHAGRAGDGHADGPAPVLPPGRAPVLSLVEKEAIAKVRLLKTKARLAGRPGTAIHPLPATLVAATAVRPPSVPAGTGRMHVQPQPLTVTAPGVPPIGQGSSSSAGPVQGRKQRHTGGPTIVTTGAEEGAGTVNARRLRSNPPTGGARSGLEALLRQHEEREASALSEAQRAHSMRVAAVRAVAAGGEGPGARVRLPGSAKEVTAREVLYTQPRGLHMRENESMGKPLPRAPRARAPPLPPQPATS